MLKDPTIVFYLLGQGMRLSDLKIGQTAQIHTHNFSQNPNRLAELGLTPGAQISLVRKSARGHTLQVEVRKTQLCIRREDADLFLVQLI
jgi:Fe2+ transport system protein FeoA